MTLPWLTITPLGIDVEPDVYWRYARSSARSAGSCHASPRSMAMASVMSHVTSQPDACDSICVATSAVVRTSDTVASDRIASSRASSA